MDGCSGRFGENQNLWSNFTVHRCSVYRFQFVLNFTLQPLQNLQIYMHLHHFTWSHFTFQKMTLPVLLSVILSSDSKAGLGLTTGLGSGPILWLILSFRMHEISSCLRLVSPLFNLGHFLDKVMDHVQLDLV